MTSLNSEEKTVLSLIAQGYQNEDIADVMCKSPHTIKNHKTRIKHKLGIAASCTHLYQQAAAWLQTLYPPIEDNPATEGGG